MAIQVILVTLHLPFMFVMFWKEWMGFSPQCFHSFVEGEWVPGTQVWILAFPLHIVCTPILGI
jgi:hypothetical protein